MRNLKYTILLLMVLVLLTGCAPAEQYDVIVVGGEPEGVSAAVMSARSGMKTLLIEDDEALGGLMTLGGLDFIDMCVGRDGTLLTRGTFEEFYNAVGGTAFDITQAKDVFRQMVDAEPNLTLMQNASFEKAIVKKNVIRGVVVRQDGKKITCKADYVIDATQDGDVAAAAGAPFTILGEDYGQNGKDDGTTGVTLVFELSGVDWHEVAQYLRQDGNPNTDITEKAAWGYNEYSAGYEPQHENMRLRGLNIARQNNGNVLVNGFIILGVDPLSAEDRQRAMAEGTEELSRVVQYLRDNYAGFADAQLAGTAEQLYVRESRHILGEYCLTLDDVLENRCFPDMVAIGSYPVDVPPNPDLQIGIIIGNPDRYGVPFGCLVPQTVENLLVVGRSASYTSLAAGSARVIPLGMAEGDAAGIAAGLARETGRTFRGLNSDADAIRELQARIMAQGGYLEPWEPVKEAVEEHPAYDSVKVLRSMGLLYGGYSNDYMLDEAITAEECDKLLCGALKSAGMEAEPVPEVYEEGITRGEAVQRIAELLGQAN